MPKRISILIANYESREAIQLCIESIVARTRSELPYDITVYNSPAIEEGGHDRAYLRALHNVGQIKLIDGDKDLSHGHALTLLLKQCEADYAVALDSDSEILAGDWLDSLVARITEPNDVMVALRREGGPIGGKYLISQTLWLACALFNMPNYRLIEADDNLPETMIRLEDYAYKEQFTQLPPVASGWDGWLGIETGGLLADRLTYSNERHLLVKPLPVSFFADKVRHFGGISRNCWRPDHPELKWRWDEIKAHLNKLREAK